MLRTERLFAITLLLQARGKMTAERLAQIMDVSVRTISYGDGRASESVTLRRQDILEPAAIRAIPPGTALLLATGIRPALIATTPWYTGPRASQIKAAIHDAEALIRNGAIEADPWYRNQPPEPPF